MQTTIQATLELFILGILKKISEGLLPDHLLSMTKVFWTPSHATVMDTLQDKSVYAYSFQSISSTNTTLNSFK